MRFLLPVAAVCFTFSASHLSADEAKPAWLERSSLSVTESEDYDVQFEFETIQPIMQTPETKTHTLLSRVV